MNFLTGRSPLIVSINAATTNALEVAINASQSNGVGSLLEQGGLLTHNGEAIVSLPTAANNDMILRSASSEQKMEWAPRYISIQAVLIAGLPLQTLQAEGPVLPNRFMVTTTYQDVYSFNITDIGVYSVCGIFQVYMLEEDQASSDAVEYVFKTSSDTLFHAHHMVLSPDHFANDTYAHTIILGGYISIVNTPIEVVFSIRKMNLTGNFAITGYATESVRLNKIA